MGTQNIYYIGIAKLLLKVFPSTSMQVYKIGRDMAISQKPACKDYPL